MIKTKLLTIQKVIIRTFILTTTVVVLFALFGALYFNYKSTTIVRNNNIQKIHETLTHLMTPSLKITDTTEIRRLLKMVSSENETFSVINANNDILLADYAQLGLIRSIITSTDKISCQRLNNIAKTINGRRYWIHCTPIFTANLLDSTERIGTLLSLSYYSSLSISPLITYFISSLLIGFMLTIVILRHILKKWILNPLVELKNHIVSKATSPLLNDNSKYRVNAVPLEILAIENAFEKVVCDLQNEYQMRIKAEKDKALLDLAAHVAHDIRSPLAVMEITLANLPKSTSIDQIHMLKEAIHKVRTIANDLLTRYRNQDSDIQSIFLADALKSIVLIKQQEWQHNPCDITVEIDSCSSMFKIHTSLMAFSRMISNLLNNAYESLREHRSIHVSLANVNDRAQLVISDTGCGIPNDKILAVLNGLSLKDDGNGLGLSSAKRCMENMGGGLKIMSNSGKGTDVILNFE